MITDEQAERIAAYGVTIPEREDNFRERLAYGAAPALVEHEPPREVVSVKVKDPRTGEWVPL